MARRHKELIAVADDTRDDSPCITFRNSLLLYCRLRVKAALESPISKPAMEILYLLLLGVIVGAAGTLIGAGGGFILMPVFLVIYKDKSPAVLTAVSLAAICANAVSGSIAYGLMKRIDYRAGCFFALAATPGAILGAIIIEYIPIATFTVMFGLMLVFIAGYLFISAGAACAGGQADATTIGPYNLKIGMLMSTVVGFLSSILGIGGGVIHVPMMVYVLRFPVHFATATSHFVLAVMTLVATIVHLALGDLKGQWLLVIPLAAGVVFGAQAGARLSRHVKSAAIIRLLALALILAGVRAVYQALWQ